MTITLQSLYKIPFFKDFDFEQNRRFFHSTQWKTFRKNECVYDPLQTMDAIGILVKGRVALSGLHKGERSIYIVLEPGDFIGSFFPDVPKHCASALEESQIIFFPRKIFKELLSNKPSLFYYSLKQLTERCMQFEERIFEFSLLNAKERLVTVLEMLNRKNVIVRKKHHKQRDYLTHAFLADMAGLSRVTVTNLLKEIKKDKKYSSLIS